MRAGLCGYRWTPWRKFAEQMSWTITARRGRPLYPRVIAAGGDAQDAAHRGDGVTGPVLAHELEPLGGITSVSRANPAAAFERMSRSNLSWRFSRRRRLSSSRSAVVRPSSRGPHRGRPVRPSCGSPAPTARTPSPILPACDQHEPALSSAGETPAHKGGVSLPSWTPKTQTVGCPRNRVNFILDQSRRPDIISINLCPEIKLHHWC